VEALDRTAFLVATATCAKPARQLLDSGQPYKTALGLRVLGASRAEGAATILTAFHASGKAVEAKKADGLDGMEVRMQEEMVDSNEGERRRQAIRLGALSGLGHLGSKEAGAALAQARKTHVAGRLDPKKYEDRLSNENLLYQQALVSALRCGDEAVAADVVEVLMENIYLVARARTEANKPKDRLERVHNDIGWELVWQRDLYRQVNAAPAAVLPALAKALAAEKDRRVAPIALAVFAGRDLPDEARVALRASPHEAVRLLAR
jgi:hypothetical protein